MVSGMRTMFFGIWKDPAFQKGREETALGFSIYSFEERRLVIVSVLPEKGFAQDDLLE